MRTLLKVAVTQRVEVWKERNERRDALDQRLIQFLLMAGMLPIPVPNNLLRQSWEQVQLGGSLSAWLEAIEPQAVLLSGGNDIGECVERDHTERQLLDYAKAYLLPVLGICRGMQMLAMEAGGSLVSVNGHVLVRHRLQTTGSESWPIEVNSFHNIGLASCPPGYVSMACSEDKTIEAIRHESLPWEGWMWHPERETVFSSADVHRLQTLFRT